MYNSALPIIRKEKLLLFFVWSFEVSGFKRRNHGAKGQHGPGSDKGKSTIILRSIKVGLTCVVFCFCGLGWI